ncbi:uncharacterized protein LODBEIA_P39950 [Lodderomyces beijingensis]|uniref:Uncharacterized protein n=1 Tax=Lodderomyces beijingensis TaxID=1775926 RepID=A0ABP0ZRQ8_9ASCO
MKGAEEYTGLLVFFSLCCLFILVALFYFSEMTPVMSYGEIREEIERQERQERGEYREGDVGDAGRRLDMAQV